MSIKIRITYLEVTYSEDTLDFHELMRHILSQPEFQVSTLIAEKANVEEIVATKSNLIIEDLRRRESPNLTLHRKITSHPTVSGIGAQRQRKGRQAQ